MNTFKLRNKHIKDYFEGWYIRLTGNEINSAIIFGITYYKDDPHAFIQYSNTIKTSYIKFNLDQVEVRDSSITIGDNCLTTNSLFINIENIKIDVVFDKLVPLKKGLINNSIMSLLYYLPLECYQEVIYLDGIYIDQDLTGKVYIEKTYGRKFPKEWVWIESDYPISFAAAKMPLLFNTYGFYCLFIYNNKQYIFSTYKFGRLKLIKEENKVYIRIKQGRYILKLHLEQQNTFKLLGPSDKGNMIITVNESLDSILNLEFYYKNKLLSKKTLNNTACEVEKK